MTAAPARNWAACGLAAGLGAVCLALDLLSNGDVVVTVAPLLVLGALALIWFVPLRWTLLALLFLGVTLEAPYEAFAGYQFRTPLWVLGTALLGNLNLVTRIGALKFSGFDLMMAYLFLVHAVRRVRRSTVDGPGFVPLPRPLLVAALLSASAITGFWLWGLSRGGDFGNSLWQVQKPLYIPLLMVLLHAGFRGPRDLRALGVALIVAGLYRAALAIGIHYLVQPGGFPMPYATTHADTILFAAALMLIVVARNEGVPLARSWLALPAAAVILFGIVCNGRRLAWVSLIGASILVALVSPWTPLKRRIARLGLLAIPFAAVYLAAGWNSGSRLFAPAAMVRSLVDTKSDSSTLWRDLENLNLVRNIAEHPVIGVGFGHKYVQYIKTDDISELYPQYRFIPHNSVLALFAFTGALGVAGIWALFCTIVFLAARAYHHAFRPGERAAAMMCMVLVFLHVNEVYGDIGVTQWLTPLTIAPAAMIAGKLALSTGAWPWRGRRRASQPAPAVGALAGGPR